MAGILIVIGALVGLGALLLFQNTGVMIFGAVLFVGGVLLDSLKDAVRLLKEIRDIWRQQ